jgi:hypothetical protein
LDALSLISGFVLATVATITIIGVFRFKAEKENLSARINLGIIDQRLTETNKLLARIQLAMKKQMSRSIESYEEKPSVPAEEEIRWCYEQYVDY